MKKSHHTLDILHHVGVINYNLDILSERYEKLGFFLTPLSTPKIVIEPGGLPTSLGVGNRHAIFENNYLELLGIVDPGKWAALDKGKLGPYNIDTPLNRYEGLHVMHFGTTHIEAVKERLGKQDIACSAIKNFERNVKSGTAEQIMRARTISFPTEMMAEGLVQIAQHDTPELIFQPQFMLHNNGAVALTEIILCCENPKEYVIKYERLTAHPGVKTDENNYMIELGQSRIILVAPDCLARIIPNLIPPAIPFMAAFTVETCDLQLTKNVLLKNNIPFTEKSGRIIIDAVHGGGSAVIFQSV